MENSFILKYITGEYCTDQRDMLQLSNMMVKKHAQLCVRRGADACNTRGGAPVLCRLEGFHIQVTINHETGRCQWTKAVQE